MTQEYRDEQESSASSRLQPKPRHHIEHVHRTSHSHLPSSRNETRAFNKAWMKNGESMTLFQRVGFTVFSLLSLLCGTGMLLGAILSFRDGDASGYFDFAVSIVLIVPGVLGIRNVLRFRKRNSEDPY